MQVVKGKVVEIKWGPKRIWDNFVEVGSFQKTTNTRVIISAAVVDGIRQLNIREFYKSDTDGEWYPTRKGMTMPLVLPIGDGMTRLTPIKDFLEMLPEAVKVAETIDLYDENNAVYKGGHKYYD